ncbi:MAG: hypothetical protein IKP65_04835 [Alphaproteobacteria bacterium]|nr:hypothetical protein [Alphaproteobacteria bacterium]
MENFKTGDKVNILIGFYDDNDIITKENLFFIKDIKIEECEEVKGVFYTETIYNVKPVNYHGYIPGIGYSFSYSVRGDSIVQFNAGYNAMIYISKTSYFEMKKEFFDDLSSDCQKEIDRLEEKIKENKKQIEIFKNMKD